ncbi:hypothetical protein [Spiroplasma endosymbiont of Tricholauxania praeusta]|uniref:hypothetical protein n=1 Tax=Spiroplasma endosymbiont of Tricholauxania praeusta TaxID=3066296 RepID=UPI0030D3F7E8
MNKNNIIIAIEDIDRLEDKKITELISLLNSLIAKINKQVINENSKLILTIDLNIISEKNINLLSKSNYSIINTTTHTNIFLCTWAETKIGEYLDSISQEIFVEFPWILTIREFKKIVKDSIIDFDFFKKSKFLSLFYSELISFNFFLIKNLLVFSFKKENILNKKISWLLTKDYYKEINLSNEKKKDAIKEYTNLNFGEIPLFLQELILDNIYLGIIGSTNNPKKFNYTIFYITNKLDYVPIENKLESFLKIIQKRFKNIILPGLDYISLTLKKELLNLDTDFTNFDNIYADLILKIRSNFNDTEINELVKLINNITSSELDNNLVGLDSYIKNKFNHYLNSNKSPSFSNQIIYQKIGLKFDKKII